MSDDEPTLDQYRDRIAFDETVMVSHPADCSPDSCSLVGYKRDGELRYQEQTGTYPVVDPDTPDWNPRGCSRQCSFTDATYGNERITQPMKQTGERGSNEWEPISWNQAYREIAEAVVDAVEDNPQSIVGEITPGEGGLTYGSMPFSTLVTQLGGVNLDGDALIGDFDTGQYMTFGKFNHGPSDDDWFNAETLLVWHANPAYSRNPSYHFLTEARYNGTDIVTIAPDYSPTCVHADQYVPVEPASDAALALGMARVVIEEELLSKSFVERQTDLPLLVRDDTDQFLRESDLQPDGHDERFYLWDETTGLSQAPRDTLEMGSLDPELQGTYEVDLDGETVQVRPVFDRLRDGLETDYDLDTVHDITGVPPDVVRDLAESVADNRTAILNSFNVCKTFHGDLIERAMALVLGLTGNWGRPGTGMRGWGAFGEITSAEDTTPELVEGAVRETAGRDLTDEEVARRSRNAMIRLTGSMVPAVFWWYRHCGYDEVWDDADLSDAGIPRQPSDYMDEAMDRGWWDGIDRPHEDADPNVLLLSGSNTLRRTRGGTRVLLEELWPKLDTIVSVDYRWSTTALYSDIVLPAAFHHEKEQFDSMVTSEMRFVAYADKVIEPRHESKPELQIVGEIVSEVEAVAADHGLDTFEVPRGITVDRFNDVLEMADTSFGKLPGLPPEIEESLGTERRYDALTEHIVEHSVLGGDDRDETKAPFTTADEMNRVLESIVEDCIDSGLFDETTLTEIKERGYAKYEGLGRYGPGLEQAATVEPDKPMTSFSQHVEQDKPFPTTTGRAQFYIDHEWFLEANESLPVHKDPPASMGGDRDTYPFYITTGHNRHSTQGVTLASDVQMNQHRGEPHVFISRQAAERKNIDDGDYVRVYNDYGEFTVQAKVSSQPADDQIVIYHAWDHYLYPDGKGHQELTPGLIKPLYLAGGYGHFEYRSMNWQPQQVDRHVTVDIERVDPSTSKRTTK